MFTSGQSAYAVNAAACMHVHEQPEPLRCERGFSPDAAAVPCADMKVGAAAAVRAV
jgi:hypothetical protein